MFIISSDQLVKLGHFQGKILRQNSRSGWMPASLSVQTRFCILTARIILTQATSCSSWGFPFFQSINTVNLGCWLVSIFKPSDSVPKRKPLQVQNSQLEYYVCYVKSCSQRVDGCIRSSSTVMQGSEIKHQQSKALQEHFLYYVSS